MLFNLSAHTDIEDKKEHEAADIFLPEQTIRMHPRSVTRTKHVFIQKTQRESMFLLMMKHFGRHRPQLFLFCLHYACNYKTPRVPWATYCSFSSSLLWPKSDLSADIFIVTVFRGPSIHSTLYSSYLFDCGMLRFLFKTIIMQTRFWQSWKL